MLSITIYLNFMQSTHLHYTTGVPRVNQRSPEERKIMFHNVTVIKSRVSGVTLPGFLDMSPI